MSAVAAGPTSCGSPSSQGLSTWWPRPFRLSQTQLTFEGNLMPFHGEAAHTTTEGEIWMRQFTQEQKAERFDLGRQFMSELLDSVETLTGVADEYGAQTLADLMYLHGAILADGFIDVYPYRSAVTQVIESLPSASTWTQFVQLDEQVTDDSRSYGPHHR
jgi:hypothetical protein